MKQNTSGCGVADRVKGAQRQRFQHVTLKQHTADECGVC